MKVFFDDLTFVSARGQKVRVAMMSIDVHDVPDHRPAADLYHGLGTDRSFFGQPGPAAAGQNHDLHGDPPNAIDVSRPEPYGVGDRGSSKTTIETSPERGASLVCALFGVGLRVPPCSGLSRSPTR